MTSFVYIMIVAFAYNGRPATITVEFSTLSACRLELERIVGTKKLDTILYTNCAPKQ